MLMMNKQREWKKPSGSKLYECAMGICNVSQTTILLSTATETVEVWQPCMMLKGKDFPTLSLVIAKAMSLEPITGDQGFRWVMFEKIVREIAHGVFVIVRREGIDPTTVIDGDPWRPGYAYIFPDAYIPRKASDDGR